MKSIDDMGKELDQLKIELQGAKSNELICKVNYKISITTLNNTKKSMNQSIRDRKRIELKISRLRSKITSTPYRLRKWSKDNPGKVMNKIIGD